MLTTGLEPIVGWDPKVLILGSMPGKTSLRLQQYYGNARNSFWSIMGEICGAKPELPYLERTARLTRAGIALWDVLKLCEREGSLESHILKDTEVPNDFDGFFQFHPTIEMVCFNGQKAAKSFEKMVMPELSRDFYKRTTLPILPSTSPANTTKTRAEKFKLWTQAIGQYLVDYKG
jgi:double-stranded uracil-DNA glycosylase